MSIININDLDLYGKRVLIRSDFNVPIKEGKILSDTRIISSLPTIELAIKKGAKVMVTSHLGRPNEGTYDEKLSLLPIANYLKQKLNNNIFLAKEYLNGIEINNGDLVILENVRFNKGEKKNQDLLAKKYASLCDVFVMDAFGASHRVHASTNGVIKFAPVSCAGLLFSAELEALKKIMINPKRPLVAIIGGSKVSTKFNVLHSIMKIADTVIVGGGIANTFIAIDNKVGKSLYELDFVESARFLRNKYAIPVPIDCRVGIEFSENANSTLKKVYEINDNEEIMDFGDETAISMSLIIKKAKTILWNGPVGVFEFKNFRKGTEIIANAIANSSAFSVAGGGDTIAAIELFNIKDKISYISTGGGAFLEFIEGKKLPAVSMLEKKHIK